MNLPRNIIKTFVCALALAVPPAAAVAAPKAPYKVLYNSDSTHILSCASPWHATGEPLAERMFVDSVNEAAAAGVDAYMMAPGLGWVPWWPSKVLPPQKQAEWFRERFDMPKARTPFYDYVLQGKDMIKVSLDACKKRGVAFFISYRMNDQHGKTEFATKPMPNHMLSIPQFYVDNPQYLLGKQPKQASWGAYLQNWAKPEVRDYKFKLIEELCHNYDIDGMEFDFMRAPYYFRLDETNSAQRKEIMTSYIKRLRKLLDETSKPGARRWMCVRIPSYASAHDAMGVDIAAWRKAGVDMFELSSFFDTEQTTDFAAIRAQAPDAAFYPEVTYSIGFNGDTTDRSYRRATKEFLETCAHLSYARGGSGVMLFNYQYYRDARGRKTDLKADEPFTEPPFQWIKALGEPAAVAKGPQYYLINAILYADPRRESPFPAKSKPGARLEFDMDMAPPSGGWKTDARLRVQSVSGTSLKDCRFDVLFNGVLLKPSADSSEAYAHVYTQMRGASDELKAWTLPVSAMKPGRNKIIIKQVAGAPVQLLAIDVNAK